MNQEPNNLPNCPICGRPTHKESKYCIFHASAEEKTEEDFKKALKEYVDKIKKEDDNYDFEKFIFVGDIDFKKDFNIIVFKITYFEKATFEERVSFSDTTFKKGASFENATFKKGASFENATFEEGASFKNATFEERVSFFQSTFEKRAYFEDVTFKIFDKYWAYATFNESTFRGVVSFSDSTFEGLVSFDRSIFEEFVFFNRTTFIKDASFRESIFEKNVFFEEATFIEEISFFKSTFGEHVLFKSISLKEDIDLHAAKATKSGNTWLIIIKDGKGKIILNSAYLENTNLVFGLAEGISIDLANTLLRNTKIKKEQIEYHILPEKEKIFSEAQEIFLLLKNNFHSIGRYEDESWAFQKEKEMERKSYSFDAFTKNMESKEKKNEEKDQKVKKSNFISYLNWLKDNKFRKWLWSCFCNAIYGYGEKPWNVVISAGVIIIFFALLFSSIGISNPEIIDLKGITVDQNTGNIVDSASKGLLKNNVIRNIPDSLYFSTITFTTLGYGDFRPLEGWGRILAGSEAFIGAFMMALFVYTFARRTGGR